MPAAFDSDDSASISSESSGGFTEVVSRMAGGAAGASDKALEEKYQKLSLLEHIRKIPDTYIGSIEKHALATYLYQPDTQRFAEETISYVPGFYKIFDEVLVNALDQVSRLASANAADVRPVKNIKVDIDPTTGWISVSNDGDGIDVEKHPGHDNIWIPELIFGELLTGTNYDPSEERLWGGKNGYGAKLANIFSKEFIVETIDHRRKKIYSQRFYNNMESRDKASVKASSKAPYTTVRFLPDYARFGMTGMDAETLRLFERRVYDACATTPATVSVYFNGKKLDIKDFEKYADLFIGDKAEKPRATESQDRWDVLATVSDDGQFHQVSFVNGINTLKGGRHVEYITNQITKKLVELAASKKKKDIKPQHIKDNLWVFVKAAIVNPAFDSQTKETLTTQVSKFGSKCELTDKFYDKLLKTGILDKAVSLTEFHEKKKLTKTDGKKTSRIFVPKLDDANEAGTKNSRHCTLILTEGDSAKSMAIAGLSVVGRDRYGVFPLRGKILNVKDVASKKILENEEITNLKKILGLTQGKEYTSVDDLRYGKIMIMTDQDSVSGDTPLLLRHPDGHVDIQTIDAIADTEWMPNANGKDYAGTDYQVWTEKGWTAIKHIMRHKTTKRMFRVLTHTGCVDATEDHSLLTEAAEKIAPGALRVGDTLLHGFPSSPHPSAVYTDSTKNEKYMGYYATKLEAMKAYYEARMGGSYPIVSLHTEGTKTLYRIAPRVLCEPIKNDNEIVKIIDLGITEQYVYDLETENHHFHAGVGQLIVHNTDGYHIRGLLFNVFQTLWPSLFKMPDFLTSMLTPIVKATHTNGTNIEFHNLTDYEHWKKKAEESAAGMRGWTIKYYKGLGTSTAEEAKKYFKDLKMLEYTYTGKPSDEGIDLAFNKSRADDRKEWLTKTYDRNRILDYSKKQVPYETFVNDELIHFSNYDLERSIPSVVDGLKVSTRKVLFGCFKKRLYSREIRVSQLSGYISEHAMYHHGETSLQQAIIGMAQNFVGANNINYLLPNGQFGTRIQGGKDAASPRYIHTLLAPMARQIFREADAAVLRYLDDDGIRVEPEYYMPIIPAILVNGGLGIGTGFSTNVPCHNPSDVIQMCRSLIAALDKGAAVETKEDLAAAFGRMEGVKLPEIHPWYLGFKGTLAQTAPGVYQSTGVWTWLDDERLEITELPVGTWTEDYKEFLTTTVAEGSPVLRDFESHYTEQSVHFILHFYTGVRAKVEKTLEKDFKLSSSKNLNMNNVHLFDARGVIRKYASAGEIVQDWAKVRVETYWNRKKHQLRKMEAEHRVLSAKVRFIQDVISGKVNIMNQKMKDIEAQLVSLKYPKLYVAEKALRAGADADEAETEATSGEDEPTGPADYEYLLRMPMKQLTQEKKQQLEKEAKALEDAIRVLRETPIQRIWETELNELSTNWESFKKLYSEHQQSMTPSVLPGKTKKPRAKAAPTVKAAPKPTAKAAPKPETKAKAKAEPKTKKAPAKAKAEPKKKKPAKE
jgi:DNA gyrase/topoisomerase IV subunit B